ncbi:hypothetical protein MiTe_04050 [Microcystis aeruginosa NIES-2520]|uniref:Uncharacterized protein n=1 Tax=Microcystis aeruginosa NIES-2520 TaxID=2303982 RepID=A0A5A5RVR8_MICAE|nr:hypothetical protein MiTe_04050 [Microcystis aeruginosa NIES-2520]
MHDFKLFQKSQVKLPKIIKLLADKGYQGIVKIHELNSSSILATITNLIFLRKAVTAIISLIL